MSEWQPIETAPKDGTRLLLWDPGREVAVSGYWHDEPEVSTPTVWEPGWAWWVSDSDVLMWDSGPHDAPSHWMPFNRPEAQ